MDRFGGDVDWSGHEPARAHLWHRQLHIFLHPFYYVEYGIAQLGALQVWANSRQDRPKALARYHRRSEEHTSELQSLAYLVCRLLLEKKKTKTTHVVRSGILR